jgi:hypothetical protein
MSILIMLAIRLNKASLPMFLALVALLDESQEFGFAVLLRRWDWLGNFCRTLLFPR